nr:MAG TPA: hypothetical protein [Caudoviricetes sp.]
MVTSSSHGSSLNLRRQFLNCWKLLYGQSAAKVLKDNVRRSKRKFVGICIPKRKF